jgi:hypothetical protein
MSTKNISLKAVQEIVDAYVNDYTEVDVRSYSGRGMVGDRCLGIVAEPGAFAEFVAGLAEIVATDEFGTATNIDASAMCTLRDQIGRVRMDAMGLSTVWYWPGIKVSDAEGSED